MKIVKLRHHGEDSMCIKSTLRSRELRCLQISQTKRVKQKSWCVPTPWWLILDTGSWFLMICAGAVCDDADDFVRR